MTDQATVPEPRGPRGIPAVATVKLREEAFVDAPENSVEVRKIDGGASVTFPASSKGRLTIQTAPLRVLQESGEAIIVNGQAVPDSVWTEVPIVD